MMRTVFIVEDDLDFGAALAELLADEGFRPLCFTSAQQALARVRHQIPALIITDVVRPGMSGGELVKALRADERWRDIPVVVVTGGNDTALALRLDTPVVYKPDIVSLLRVLPAAARSA